MGPPRILAAGRARRAGCRASWRSVASRAIRLGEELVTANLQDHLVSAPPVAAMALPLVARGAVIGAARRAGGRTRGAAARLRASSAGDAVALPARAGRASRSTTPGASRRPKRCRSTDDLTRLYNARYLQAGADAGSQARGPLGAAAVGHLPGPRRIQDASTINTATCWAAGRSWSSPASCRGLRPRDRHPRALRRRRVRDGAARYRRRRGAAVVADRIRTRVAGFTFLVGRGAGGAADDVGRHRRARARPSDGRPTCCARPMPPCTGSRPTARMTFSE